MQPIALRKVWLSTALARIDQRRAAGADCRSGGKFAPAAALGWSTLLTQASERHSQDMVAKNYFSHTGSDGSALTTRVNAPPATPGAASAKTSWPAMRASTA